MARPEKLPKVNPLQLATPAAQNVQLGLRVALDHLDLLEPRARQECRACRDEWVKMVDLDRRDRAENRDRLGSRDDQDSQDNRGSPECERPLCRVQRDRLDSRDHRDSPDNQELLRQLDILAQLVPKGRRDRLDYLDNPEFRDKAACTANPDRMRSIAHAPLGPAKY